MNSCPCGSGASYETCCGPAHDRTRPAQTPEALMRSRYSAFAKGLGSYLVATHDVVPGPKDALALSAWSETVGWLGLTIHETTPVENDEGRVSFTAKSIERGELVTLFENSRFVRKDGRWLYADGVPNSSRTKIPRNEKCPCGSGKKVKQCHG